MESGLLEAYRTLGLICDDKSFKYHREGPSSYLSFPIGSSFLTYNLDSLKIRYMGCQLEQTVNSLDTYKDLVLLACGNNVSAFYKVKLVKLYSGCTASISEILVFGEYLLGLTFAGELKVWDCESTDLLNTIPLPNEGLHILHPPTYLNKVIISVKKSKILLVNIKTGQKIYDFPVITQTFDGEITTLENAVALDVIAIGMETGKIVFANILKDEVLFVFEQTAAVTCLSVCSQPGVELLVTGNTQGFIFIWDLKLRKIQAKVRAHGTSKVTKVFFTPGESMITSSSGVDNSIKQWIFDFESPEPRLFKSREGFNVSPKFLRFYNANHLLACSDTSIRDLSVLNEHQSTELSSKHAKKAVKAQRINFKINKFENFSACTTREKDWSNVLTSNETDAFLWSFENKTLGTQKIERNALNLKSKVKATCVSECGNFGIIGMENGKMEKFNMQSGFHQFVFAGSHTGEVCGVEIDSTNSNVVSGASSGELFFWDFLTGDLNGKLKVLPVLKIRLQKSSNLLAVLHENQSDIYDIRSKTLARTFPADGLLDVAFSHDSRWLATCDKTGIRIWDIPNSKLIDWVAFKHPALSIDFSPEGKYLASVHKNSFGVFLWLNKSYYSNVIINKSPTQPRKIKGFDVAKGKNFYSKKLVKVKDLVAKELEPGKESVIAQKMPKILPHGTFKNSELPYSRISALYHLDEIKERNAPIQPPKKPEKAPFFLPDSLGIVSFDPLSTVETEKTIEKPKEKDLANVLQNSPESIIEFLKALSPASVELNIFGLDQSEIDKFTEILYECINLKLNFDFLQGLLSCFLKIHSDKLTKEQTKGLCKVQTEVWEEIEKLFIFDLSGLERLID